MNDEIKPIIMYFDDAGNIVSKEEATAAKILEYDKNGNFIGMTIGTIKRKSEFDPDQGYDDFDVESKGMGSK